MVVCKFSKFSVADGSICAMAKLRIECNGMGDDMENCPFWNRAGWDNCHGE